MDWEESGNTSWLSHDHFRSFCPSTAGRWKYLGGTTSSYLKPRTQTTFAIQQCLFGADTPKPARFLTTLLVNDSRCHFGWPQFRDNSYVGPLPKSCGHMHERKFIGHTDGKWNTGPTAAYPAGLCQFIADLCLAASQSIGRRQDDTSLDLKRTDTSLDLKRTPQPLGALVGAPGVSSASVAPGSTSLSSETGVAPESTSLSSELVLPPH